MEDIPKASGLQHSEAMWDGKAAYCSQRDIQALSDSNVVEASADCTDSREEIRRSGSPPGSADRDRGSLTRIREPVQRNQIYM